MANTDNVYVLPPTVNVHVINDILGKLNEVCQQEGEVIINARGVENIDAVGLQAIISAHKTAFKDNSALVIVNPSPYLREMLALSGAANVLNIKEEE